MSDGDQTSIELNGHNGTSYILPNLVWTYVCVLAEAFDWKPEGTRWENGKFAGTERDFSNYMPDDGRQVSAADARALANSIEKMLASPVRDKTVEIVGQGIEEGLRHLDPPWLGPVQRIQFTEQEVRSIRELIRFLRLGGFSIGRAGS